MPILLAAIGIPLALGLIAPNSFYGVRTATTLASDAAWYRANAAGGLSMVVSGIVGFALNCYIVRSDRDDRAKTNLQLAVLIAIAIIAVMIGLSAS